MLKSYQLTITLKFVWTFQEYIMKYIILDSYCCCKKIVTEWLKTHKCILSPFWRSEVWNVSHWAKITLSAGCIPFGDSREKSISLPYSVSWSHLTSFPHDPFFCSQNQQCSIFKSLSSDSPCILASPCNTFLLSFYKDFCVHSAYPKYQKNLPISGSLITSAKALVPFKVTQVQVP